MAVFGVFPLFEIVDRLCTMISDFRAGQVNNSFRQFGSPRFEETEAGYLAGDYIY
jgi:hypothetical protein